MFVKEVRIEEFSELTEMKKIWTCKDEKKISRYGKLQLIFTKFVICLMQIKIW